MEAKNFKRNIKSLSAISFILLRKRVLVGGGVFVVFFFFLFLVSCTKQSLTPREYADWIVNGDNGLLAKNEIGKYEFSALYKPIEYIVLMQTKNDLITKETIAEESKNFEGMQYYTFQIVSKDGKELMASNIQSEQQYYGRLEYFMSSMQDDISLVQGNDTLPCLLFHFERNYGMTPSANFVLGFDKPQNGMEYADRILMYYDRILGCGPVKLSISGKSISNIPKLETK